MRDARPEEHDEVRRVTRAAYADYQGVMRPRAWGGLSAAVENVLAALDDDGLQILVAEDDGGIVGSVLLYPPSVDAYRGAVAASPAPELRLLSVLPGHRGRGVGRRLVEACVERARAMGADALGLHTSKSMQPAIRLYRKLGFRRNPAQDFRPEGGELVTAYRLELG